MDINNIKDWENLGTITYRGEDYENEYTDYTDYAEKTVINYLKEHKEEIDKLEQEFNSKASTVNTNKVYIDEEVEKGEKDYEYGQ